MRRWALLLGGLLVWTVHFFGLYAIAEIAPHAWLVVGLTLMCVIVDLGLLRLLRRIPTDNGFDSWHRAVALGGVGLSLIAVLWQSAPALLTT